MFRTYLAGGVAAGLLLLGPVSWRVMTWERTQVPTVNAEQARAGETLFKHEWQQNDPLSKGGDGLGPVFNASSCVACHDQGGIGGAGGLKQNVTTYLVVPKDGDGRGEQRTGVLHADAWSEHFRETLQHLDPQMPRKSQIALAEILGPQLGNDQRLRNRRGDPEGPRVLKEPDMPGRRNQLFSETVLLSQRNTPALFGAGLIDAIPERVILANARKQQIAFGVGFGDGDQPVGRVHRLPDGKIGRFGWKAQTASLKNFVEAACANELGLSNPNHNQPVSLARADYQGKGLDLTQAQCDEITAFVASLPRPVEKAADEAAHKAHIAQGKALFTKVGCANCHTPTLGDVNGIYSDLLLHRMGDALEGSGDSYGGRRPSPSPGDAVASGPLPDEWRTPPLWGVASSGPYLHDGRAATLEEAILMHGGQAFSSARAFERLFAGDQAQLVAFLRSLQAP